MPKLKTRLEFLDEVENLVKELIEKPEYEELRIRIDKEFRGKIPSLAIRADEKKMEERVKQYERGSIAS